MTVISSLSPATTTAAAAASISTVAATAATAATALRFDGKSNGYQNNRYNSYSEPAMNAGSDRSRPLLNIESSSDTVDEDLCVGMLISLVKEDFVEELRVTVIVGGMVVDG
ncbi:hypothetical protein G7Y89_g10577 [Cudoniella acicularis]|uniref:Uncharacterized protein n=1 Tax=Cudoniella acicularis TaxID=354080 RepID=A0A8H4RF80_9HELO|nr:hypothetical protein G7Y89_g10577 [Cudoniella acicularis]